MTDKEFTDLGFREFAPTPFDSKSVEKCFQKRYDDDVGKKYFITVRKWMEMIHPHSGERIPPVYEYDVQLYKKNGHEALDLLFHSNWTLEDVEDYMEKLWNTGLFEYYRLLDE